MRLTAMLLLVVCLKLSANGYSQQITLHEQNAPLEKILLKIKQQSGYHLVYREDWMQKAENVSIDVTKASLGVALDICFKDQPFSYSIIDKMIVIKQKENSTDKNKEAVVPPLIKGRITSETGEPVAAASVQVKGKSSKGTFSDAQGYFELQDVAKDAILIISGATIETIEVKVSSDSELAITVKNKIGQMDDVMVVAYGNQKKSSFTGSASVLKADVLGGTPRSSVMESIQGNVSGVLASNGTGQPGEMPDIRIRGIGSTRGGGPLYVVDGIPLEGSSPVALNPNDVESLTVLKDAAAASLYGSRAANGVILITTKKGINGKTVFDFSTQYGINKVTLNKNVLPLNTTEMLELLREGWINSGRLAENFQAEMASNNVDPNVNTDWFDALTRNGKYQQYNLSASGGNEKTKFFISGGHYRTKAALLGSEFMRSSVAFRLSNQATSKLSFNVNLKLSHRGSDEQEGDGSNGNPVRMYKRYQPWLKIYNADGTYDLSYANRYNPVAVVTENSNKSNKYGLLGGVLAKYQIFSWLSIENQANLDFDYRDNYDFKKSGIGTARTNGGEAEYSSGRTSNFLNTTILRFDKRFSDHELGAFIGYESQKVHSQGSNIEKENFLPNTFTLDNAASNADGGSYEDNNTLNAAFINTSYNYNKKYYLTGSFRRDGSSRFGYKNRYGNFWSVGASWNILSEEFMKDQKIFSELRLKASYGVNGNQSLGDYEARALYGTGVDYNSSPGITLSSFGNPELTWEKNKPFNVGVDFSVLKNRLLGTVEYYTRVTTDQLSSQGISATNGLTGYTANIGSIKNSGVELDLNSINIKPSTKDGFEWTTNFNISTLKNKVLSLERSQTGETRVSSKGDDFYRYNMVAYAGADPTTGESLWYVDATKTTTTKVYGQGARLNFGTALPKYFGGLGNNFSWHGITLGINVFFNFGNEIYDNWGSNANSDGGKGFSPTDKMPRYVYENRWQKPGDITDVPKIMYLGTQSGSSSHNSSRFLYKGDYIRLRDISLGYNLPQKWVQSIHVGNIRAYARASNLYTWTKDKNLNFDPEVGIAGAADQNAPIYKTILFGLDIRF